MVLKPTLHRAINEIGRTQWDALRPDDNPFTSYDYLDTLEATNCLGPVFRLAGLSPFFSHAK